MLLLHGYLWWRLVRSTTPPGRTRRLLTLVLVVVAVLPVGAVVLRRQDSLLSTVVQWVGFSWLGVAFYLFLTLLALEPVRLLLRRRSRGAARPTTVAEDDQVVASGARRAPRSDDAAARAGSGTAPEPEWTRRGGRRLPDRDTGSGSAQQGDGSWPRCRPEDDGVIVRGVVRRTTVSSDGTWPRCHRVR